jgi:hypothetical protein
LQAYSVADGRPSVQIGRALSSGSCAPKPGPAREGRRRLTWACVVLPLHSHPERTWGPGQLAARNMCCFLQMIQINAARNSRVYGSTGGCEPRGA